MIYAVMGVPITLMLLSCTSSLMGGKLFKLYRSKLSRKNQQSRLVLGFGTLSYVLIGLLVFIAMPAAVFCVVEEDWSYLDSVYFAFITITTIGFGDLVSGKRMEAGPEKITYHVLVIAWITCSLGYWVMVANFISRALSSERLHAQIVRRAKVLKSIMARTNRKLSFLENNESKKSMGIVLQLGTMLVVPPGRSEELYPGTSNLFASLLSSGNACALKKVGEIPEEQATRRVSLQSQDSCDSGVTTLSDCSAVCSSPV